MTDAIAEAIDLPGPVRAVAMIYINTMGEEEAQRIGNAASDALQAVKDQDWNRLEHVLLDGGIPSQFVELIMQHAREGPPGD